MKHRGYGRLVDERMTMKALEQCAYDVVIPVGPVVRARALENNMMSRKGLLRL